MSSDVEDTIIALREALKAENDADLARKLRIDKSTVSSWRSRGRVPDRFRRILGGDNHQAVATPPLRWGEHEDTAFELTLFRYARLFGPAASVGDFKTAMEVFSNRSFLWFMFSNAQDDLIARQKDGASLSTAFALNLHEDIASPEATKRRDLERLERHYQGLSLAQTLKHLKEANDL